MQSDIVYFIGIIIIMVYHSYVIVLLWIPFGRYSWISARMCLSQRSRATTPAYLHMAKPVLGSRTQ